MTDLKNEPTGPDDKIDRKATEKETDDLREKLSILQSKLYASRIHSVLIVLQGMDTAGKDGTISHVFTAINPQGCNVRGFKSPTEEEASHDFLWRIYPHTPAKGMMEIFNRSHYEDILFPSVHKTIDKDILERRYELINRFEEELIDSGTVVLKFFLHLSKEEQKKRLAERLADPHKRWKSNPNDMKEEKFFDDYQRVFEKIIDRCSPKIPWTIVPSDHKWYRNYIVAKELVQALEKLKLEYPL